MNGKVRPLNLATCTCFKERVIRVTPSGTTLEETSQGVPKGAQHALTTQVTRHKARTGAQVHPQGQPSHQEQVDKYSRDPLSRGSLSRRFV